MPASITDLDLRLGTVHWRAEHDKLGFETVTPLTAAAVKALEGYRAQAAVIGQPWVFPARGCTQPTGFAHVCALVERRGGGSQVAAG